MRHDLLDTFSARFPHLTSRIAAASADIAEAEALLDDATDAGLQYRHFCWIDLHEISIQVEDDAADRWLNHLGALGYRSRQASFSASTGSVTAHLRHASGRRIGLVILNPKPEHAQ